MDQLVRLLTEDHLSLRKDHLSLKKLVAELATATRKGFDRVAKQSAETDKRIDKLAITMEGSDRRKRETDKKFDERVDKLVVAIGEFIRRQNGHK